MAEDIKKPVKRYYRKRVELFRLIGKIKLWPSRTGVLHGIRSIERTGDTALITTHCNRSFTANNSRNCRAARWLRNKLFIRVCGDCHVPDWKLEKYNSTRFHRHFGSDLDHGKENQVMGG
ncbi:MAG: pyrrolysine--tRNA(Pyl) ligase small subunit [Desulfobacterales bacterium]